MSWGWRIIFLIIWCGFIAPAINETLTLKSTYSTALFYGIIQSAIYVIGLVPLILKYASIKGIRLNIYDDPIEQSDNRNFEQNKHKTSIPNKNMHTNEVIKKVKPRTSKRTNTTKPIKVEKYSFNQQVEIIEDLIVNTEFPQGSNNEQYTYELDYNEKENVISLDINVNNQSDKVNNFLLFSFKINLKENYIMNLDPRGDEEGIRLYKRFDELLRYMNQKLKDI